MKIFSFPLLDSWAYGLAFRETVTYIYKGYGSTQQLETSANQIDPSDI